MITLFSNEKNKLYWVIKWQLIITGIWKLYSASLAKYEDWLFWNSTESPVIEIILWNIPKTMIESHRSKNTETDYKVIYLSIPYTHNSKLEG